MDGFAELFRYNQWATETLLDACRVLDDAQLDARPPGVSGSVRELLLHIVGGQQTFVLRTQGRQHEGELNRASPWPGFAALTAIATRSSEELVSIAETLNPNGKTDLAYGGRAYRFPTAFFLVHALEHGMEHRTEVKVALAQLGVETPDLDGWSYASTRGYGKEVS